MKPDAGIETKALFASPLLVRDSQAVILEGFLASVSESVARVLEGSGRNDMQPAAEASCAEVAQAASLLQTRFGNSRMTGSGSAVFARAGANALPSAVMPSELPAGWVGRMCRSLEVHPLAGWADD
jgi:4-diphosphocytidyl-2-C-methyl-D-erythritol kinase